MAKFTIMRSTGYEKEVEAEEYVLSGDYFWFKDVRDEDVFTIKASDVHSIERQTTAK